MKPSTQVVLDLLLESESVCASVFLERRFARYGARLHELKAMGYIVDKEPCRRHEHPHGPVYRYTLIALPEPSGQIALVGG